MIDRRNESAPRSERLTAFVTALGLTAWMLALGACSTPHPDAVDRTGRPQPLAEGAAPSERGAAPSNEAFPPFYHVSGGSGAELYILGTVHLGPTRGWRFAPAILDAIGEAEGLVAEIDLRELDEAAASAAVGRHGLLPIGETLSARISPETAAWMEKRSEVLARLPIPKPAQNQMRPWLIAVSLTELTIADSGYSPAASADALVSAAFARRELIGLESLDEQLALLSGLPPELEDLFLRDTLIRFPELSDAMGELVATWQRGDEKGLFAYSRDGLDELPELEAVFEVLLDDRNRKWIRPLRGLLDDTTRAGSKMVVAVGALHVVGPVGLPALLGDAGYRVERIEASEKP